MFAGCPLAVGCSNHGVIRVGECSAGGQFLGSGIVISNNEIYGTLYCCLIYLWYLQSISVLKLLLANRTGGLVETCGATRQSASLVVPDRPTRVWGCVGGCVSGCVGGCVGGWVCGWVCGWVHPPVWWLTLEFQDHCLGTSGRA